MPLSVVQALSSFNRFKPLEWQKLTGFCQQIPNPGLLCILSGWCVFIKLSGARLYFTVTAFGQMPGGVFSDRLSGMMSTSARFYPSILTLIHVRLPPGFTVGLQHRPTNVHSAFYQHGRSACLFFCGQPFCVCLACFVCLTHWDSSAVFCRLEDLYCHVDLQQHWGPKFCGWWSKAAEQLSSWS